MATTLRINTNSDARAQGGHIAVFALLDALGWSYIRDRSFLPELDATRTSLRTILGFSSAAIPTIISGLMPAEHGHWNALYRADGPSPFAWTRWLAWVPRVRGFHRRFRRLVERACRHTSGCSGYFNLYDVPLKHLQYFDYNERRNAFAPGGLNRGRSIWDDIADAGLPFYLSLAPNTDEQALDGALAAIREGQASFLFMHLSAVDSFLHRYCDDEAAVSERLLWYEERLRALLDAARERGLPVHMYAFSDHGMVPTRRTVDLMGLVESLDLRIPNDYLPFYDSTMARFWCNTYRASSRLALLLASLDCGRVLRDEELASLGVLFPDHRFGDLIFLTDPGVIIAPSYMGRNVPRGMHGFHPDHELCDAMLISNVALPDPPTHIRDIYRLMLAEVSSLAATRAAPAQAQAVSRETS
jgi:hypothetical protein